MRHLATVTVGAALLLAVSNGPAGSSEVTTGVTAAVPVVSISYAQPATVQAAKRRCPPGTYAYKVKTRKGKGGVVRCIRPGLGYGTVIGTWPGAVVGPTPNIVTFGNGAGSGITTFGHSQGVNPNSGTGPFGNLGGTTVGR
jgi:hypothetical protein